MADSDIDDRTLRELGTALRSGATTSAELTAQCLRRIADEDGQVGAFLRVFAEPAMSAANAADRDLQSGRDAGPLHGIPFAIKDILFTREGPTTAQSLVVDPRWPQADGPVVERLRRAGAIIVGKTTTMEYAAGSPDASKPFPVPRNPWNLEHWAGGSSSGSASAVAAGFVPAAIGTDTGGSVRIPASYCGLTGLKPTFGLVPKRGCVPLAYSFDSIGPMARTAEDCALILDVIAGRDAGDRSTARGDVADHANQLTGDVRGLRIGVDARRPADLDPSLRSALDTALAVLETAGATVTPIELPCHDELILAYGAALAVESLAYHRSRLGPNWDRYTSGAKLRFAEAAFYSGADYVHSQRIRAAVGAQLPAVFDRVDVVANLTSYTDPPPLADLDEDFTSWIQNATTRYWSGIGHPAISVPIGFSAAGLPIGMQLAGAPFSEPLLLRTADAYQRAPGAHVPRVTRLAA